MPTKGVLITGGSGGVGRHICLQLGRLGWRVIVGYRNNAEGAQELVREIARNQGVASALKVDLNDVTNIDDRLAEISAGSLSAVVFCAGLAPVISPILKLSRENLLEQFNAMVFGHFELLKHIWRTQFLPQRYGHVVAVSSVATELPPPPQMTGYVLAKSALESLIQCSCVELGSRGLRATIVRPGYIDSAMLSTAFDPRFIEQLGRRGQLLAPATVATVIVKALLEPPDAGQVAVRSIRPGDHACH